MKNINLIVMVLAIAVGFGVGGYIGNKDAEEKKVVLTKDIEQLFKPRWDKQDSIYNVGYQMINDSLKSLIFRFEKTEEILFNFNLTKHDRNEKYNRYNDASIDSILQFWANRYDG